MAIFKKGALQALVIFSSYNWHGCRDIWWEKAHVGTYRTYIIYV